MSPRSSPRRASTAFPSMPPPRRPLSASRSRWRGRSGGWRQRECYRARLHRHRDDRAVSKEPSASAYWPKCVTPPGGGGGRRCDVFVSHGRGRTQYNRRCYDGRRGEHGIATAGSGLCQRKRASPALNWTLRRVMSNVLDRGVPFRIERHIQVSPDVEDVKRIVDAFRVKALIDIDSSLRFEGLGGLDLGGEAQEERPGVFRQCFELRGKSHQDQISRRS